MTAPTPTSWCWIDGRVLPTDEATIAVTDHGLTVGDGIFETMKVVDGTPFALTRHLRRLHRSADALALALPMSDDELRRACAAVIEGATGQGAPVGRVRLTVTGGPGPAGSDRGGAAATVLVVTSPPSSWEATTRVATVPFTRNPTGALAGVKSTSYAENVLALARAQAAGCLGGDLRRRPRAPERGHRVQRVRGPRRRPAHPRRWPPGASPASPASWCWRPPARPRATTSPSTTCVGPRRPSSPRRPATCSPSPRSTTPPWARAPGPTTLAAAEALAAVEARSLDP